MPDEDRVILKLEASESRAYSLAAEASAWLNSYELLREVRGLVGSRGSVPDPSAP